MKITILGTGSFYVREKRSGAAYLLEVDGKKILIDCGPGTLNRLSQIKVDPREIDYVFLSHFHADHSGELLAFQMNFRLNDFFFDKKLEKFPVIYGPRGIQDFTKKLGEIYQLQAFKDWSEIKYENYDGEIVLGNLVVKAFDVKHSVFGNTVDAHALRFEHEGKVFVFSGDSVKCEGIEKACQEADLFICDTSSAKGKGGPAHMDTHDIGEIAEKSKVKKVVLSHFYPNTEDVDLVGEVKEKFSGEVIRGGDLMELNL